MLPLILLLAGGAISAYAFLPKVRTRVDEFIKGIKGADTAHKKADENLARANEATATALQASQTASAAAQQFAQAASSVWNAATAWMQPWVQQQPAVAQANEKAQAAKDAAIEHIVEADTQNREAAKGTAIAAQNATTPEQRQETAQSAAKVLDRQKQIADALATLGVGQCGVGEYGGITEAVKDTLLSKLRAEGMGVSGDNPWDIDTGQYGVRLRAVWDPGTSRVRLIVSTGIGNTVLLWRTVECDDVWDKIDPIMKEVSGSSRSSPTVSGRIYG